MNFKIDLLSVKKEDICYLFVVDCHTKQVILEKRKDINGASFVFFLVTSPCHSVALKISNFTHFFPSQEESNVKYTGNALFTNIKCT